MTVADVPERLVEFAPASWLRSSAKRVCPLLPLACAAQQTKIFLRSAARGGEWDEVVELDLTVIDVAMTHLTTVFVSMNNATDDITRDVASLGTALGAAETHPPSK